MDEVNIITESVIKIEEINEESDTHLEDPVWIYSDVDESSSLKSLVMDEDEEVELKPPVKVFLETTKVRKEDVAEEYEYEDPLVICNKDLPVTSVSEKGESSPGGYLINEKCKRKRSRNFDERDKLMLIDLAIGELEIIGCKQTDQMSNEKRRNAWTRVCAKYNASSPISGPRNVEQLKCLYDVLCRNARKEKNRALAEIQKGARQVQLSETTLKVLEMLRAIKTMQDKGHDKTCDKSASYVGNDESSIFTSDLESKEEENDITELLLPLKSSPLRAQQTAAPASPQTSLSIPAVACVSKPAHGLEIVQVTSIASETLQTHSQPSVIQKETASTSHISVRKPSTTRTPTLQSSVQRQRRFNHNRLFDLKCRKEEQIIKNLEKEHEERSKRCLLLDIELEIKKKELALKVQELEKISK